jgi:hypothetical protein
LNRLTRHALECPACKRHLWGSTAVSDPTSTLEPGDGSVCDGCGAILIYQGDRGFRVAKSADLAGDPEKARQLLQISAAIRAGQGHPQ